MTWVVRAYTGPVLGMPGLLGLPGVPGLLGLPGVGSGSPQPASRDRASAAEARREERKGEVRFMETTFLLWEKPGSVLHREFGEEASPGALHTVEVKRARVGQVLHVDRPAQR